MASQQKDITSTCLICFETRPLKIVGECNHSFCTECLSNVFQSQDNGREVFACPSCQVDCPRPEDGVNGLLDFTGDTDSLSNTDTEPPIVPEEIVTKIEGQRISESTVNILCDICDDSQTKVEAINICTECNNLNICKDCTKMHSTNKATHSHLLTPVVSKTGENETMCKQHHKLLISYCQTCGKEVCNICVSVQHGDHEVERLADIIRSNVEVVKATLGLRSIKLKEMLERQKKLTLLKTMAPIVDKQDILIKEIEDHAEKRINEIIKWKEDLKKQVKLDYKVVRDIPECLEKVSDVIQKMQPPIERAAQLVSETKHHPVYLDNLKTMQRDLEAIATTGDNVGGSELRSQLFNLNSGDNFFVPHHTWPSSSCGEIEKIPKSVKSDFEPKELLQHKMAADSVDMFIPCVAVLGHKYYAVAHPVKANQLGDAIDIYELSGTLKNTLRDQVPPLYDMTSNPDGKLAVLSKGRTSACSVKLFDQEAGYITSTRDIDVAKPLSLSVNLQNQYVILGENDQGEKEITIVDKDGVVELKHVINQDLANAEYSSRITCGGRFIFVKGDKQSTFVVYEKQGTGLKKITISSPEGTVKDICATIWDTVFLSDVTGDMKSDIAIENVYLTAIHDKENKMSWQESNYKDLRSNVQGVDKEARVSTRDGHIVVLSHGQTVRVYKC